MNATPAKLRNGTWGARIEAPTGAKLVMQPGDGITITTKAGKSWDARVERVIWTNGQVTLVSTASSAPRRSARRGYHNGSSYTCNACVTVEDIGDMNGCERHRGNPRS